MPEDINDILGAALEARGLTPEESSDLIRSIHTMLKASNYYMLQEEHDEKTRGIKEQLEYYLQIVEAYRSRERQCCIAGCTNTQTKEEVISEVLEEKILLCEKHRNRLRDYTR